MTTHTSPNDHYLLRLLRGDLERRGLLPTTAAEYCRQLRPLLGEFEDVPLMTRQDITAWINERDTPSKRRFRWLAVKALYRMLTDEEIISENPCNGIKMPREQARPQPYVSDTDYIALLNSCDTTFEGRRDRAIITTLNSTGCRRSELVALTVGDIDLDKGTILIRRSKTGTGRYAYLDVASLKALVLWLRTLSLATHATPASTAPVWISRKGTRLGADAVRLMLQRRGDRLGIHVSPHQFRRRLAVQWHLRGGSQLGLMTAAGWSSPTMPGRYASQAAAEIAREEHRRIMGDGGSK